MHIRLKNFLLLVLRVEYDLKLYCSLQQLYSVGLDSRLEGVYKQKNKILLLNILSFIHKYSIALLYQNSYLNSLSADIFT